MLKTELFKIIKEREDERQEAVETLDTELTEANNKAAIYAGQVDKALDSGEVTEDTALAELNLRAQRRKADRLTKEKEGIKEVPLFSIQETKDLLKEVDDGYREEWSKTCERLEQISAELDTILTATETMSADHAACAVELKAAIQRNGYKIPPYNGFGAAGKAPQYVLNPNYTPDLYTREHIETAKKELDELLKERR